MRISDWISAVFSSDLFSNARAREEGGVRLLQDEAERRTRCVRPGDDRARLRGACASRPDRRRGVRDRRPPCRSGWRGDEGACGGVRHGGRRGREGQECRPPSEGPADEIDCWVLHEQWCGAGFDPDSFWRQTRSEEHTSELQSLMRISYAVFCLKKKIQRLSTDETIT